jgi:dienelactone hydrolase
VSDQRYKAYEINLKDVSPDGSWLAVYKIYDNRSDTLIIVNREDPKWIYQKIKVLDYKWTSNELILRYKNRTEIFDYNKNKSEELPACESFGINKEENLLVLYNAEKIKIYDLTNKKLIDSISSVKKIFYNGKYILALVGKDKSYKLVELKKNVKSILYTTADLITKVTSLKNRSFLIFETKDDRIQDIVYYNDLTKKALNFSGYHKVDFNFASGYQRSDGSIILTTQRPKGKKPTSAPEIWQSSESNFREKFNNTLSTEFLWMPEQRVVVELGSHKMDRIVDIDNKNYFLSFGFSEMQDYTSVDASLKLYRYDFISDDYDYIDIVQSGATYSPDGNYIIYKQNDHWKLVDINSLKAIKIENHGFFQAYFTDNNKIYFDGSEGLWEYNIKDAKLKVNYNKERGNYKILNFNYSTNYLSNLFELAFLCRTVTVSHLLFEVSDKAELMISVLEKSGNLYRKLLNNSTSKLVYKEADKDRSYFFIEENFNLPQQLISLSRLQDKKVVYRSNIGDQAQSKIKMETISYKNIDNVDLKGILYYPLDYDSEKTYPMIVHVYQLQSHKRNAYPLFLEHKISAGFSIRDLIEKGYFVYLPDIINDKRGAGLAALDCVHSSLDAVNENKSIDFQKVGLIGHSFGGYVTNYISTHSNRFATYVSGASVGDIVKSYFSMSFHFMSPLYWQYEDGQFDFSSSFSTGKELYIRNNPIYYVENVSKPILLWAGKKDLNVEWGQSMEFYLGLKRNKKSATMLVYPEEGHFISSGDTAQDLFTRTTDWFNYYLKGEKKPDWIE